MEQQYSAIKKALNTLEEAMRHFSLWPASRPSSSAMQSTVPFAVDTMSFECWLAYIFIPKMRAVINAGQPIPNMQIAPAAEVYLTVSSKEVISLLRDIDDIVNAPTKANCTGPSY